MRANPVVHPASSPVELNPELPSTIHGGGSVTYVVTRAGVEVPYRARKQESGSSVLRARSTAEQSLNYSYCKSAHAVSKTPDRLEVMPMA